MPSFYPKTLPRQLPLTPPDYYHPAFNNSTGTMQSSAASFYGHNVSETRYSVDSRDKLGYASKASTYSTVGLSAHGAYGKDVDCRQLNGIVALPRSETAYAHTAAPVLPPIRVPERSNIEQSYHASSNPQRAPVHTQPKEEKISGGVSAHLDYDMDLMVDFVSEMAQGIVQPSASVTADFRKYVSQILTSTRLPSSTVLLGLHYLSTRMTLLSSLGIFSSSNGHLYHMLTTALMLGSKFLDDNTFQNRSWAEVSHIPVTELNILELEWLADIEWNLHIDSSDPQGFSAWLAKWGDWQTKRIEITLDSLKLTPLDSSLQRQHSINKQLPPTPIYTTYADNVYAIAAKERPQSHWQSPGGYEQWPAVRHLVERSPPSAPESGPNTPDWYGRHGLVDYTQPTNTHSVRCMPALQPLQIVPSSAQSPYYNPYASQFTPSPWSAHSMACMCGYCLPYHDRYSMTRGYGAQTVAG